MTQPESNIFHQVLNDFSLGISDCAPILVHSTASAESDPTAISLNAWTLKKQISAPRIVVTDFANAGGRDAWKRGIYAFVVCNFALVAFQDALSVLKDVHHTLKAKGVAIVTCWKGEGLTSGEEELKELMDQAGWERGMVKVFERKEKPITGCGAAGAGQRDLREAWIVLAKKWDELYG